MQALGLRYTVREEVEIILACAEMNANCRLLAQLYSSRNAGRLIPAHATISSLYKHLLKTSAVCYLRRRKGVVVDEDLEIAVLAYVRANLQASTCQLPESQVEARQPWGRC
ncbi:hypothetical protein MTO96_036366 [Rhipicephalus appendiculatus]